MATITLDTKRREQLRRLHTATHIINFCAKEVLGDHVWQNGSNLKPEIGTLDITHYDHITFNQQKEIEKKANEIVFENKSVQIEEIERTKAEQQYGFRLYQGGAVPMKTLRVIHIGDEDSEACGGLHMLSTGGIGLIKLIDTQKIQDGVIRLSYVVREFALDEIHKTQELVEQTASTFSVQKENIAKTAEKFFNEWKIAKKENEKITDLLTTTLIDQAITSKQKELEVPLTDMKAITSVFKEITKHNTPFKLISPTMILATNDLEVQEYSKKIPKGDHTLYILKK